MTDDRAGRGGETGHGPAGGSAGGARGRQESVSFVMLLWLEPREAAAEPEWRWRVKWVRTGEEAHFRRVADVLAYISRHTGLPAPR